MTKKKVTFHYLKDMGGLSFAILDSLDRNDKFLWAVVVIGKKSPEGSPQGNLFQ